MVMLEGGIGIWEGTVGIDVTRGEACLNKQA